MTPERLQEIEQEYQYNSAGYAKDIGDLLTALKEAQETNRSFHRRVQTVEGKERRKRWRLERDAHERAQTLRDYRDRYDNLNETYQRVSQLCLEAHERAETAEQAGYARGIEAAIGRIDMRLGHGIACGCWGSQNEPELNRLIQEFRALLPTDTAAKEEEENGE